jgi:hypothetical protein
MVHVCAKAQTLIRNSMEKVRIRFIFKEFVKVFYALQPAEVGEALQIAIQFIPGKSLRTTSPL